MKININGITREMTPEEIAEYQRLSAEFPTPEPTDREMILELREALDLILSGVTV